MTYCGSWKIDDLLTFVINTQIFATGVATDADSAPAYRVYEDETTTPILTGTMALLDSANTAGFYSEQITLSAANGFEKGKCYSIYIAATVSTVAGATHRTFQIEAEVDANRLNWANVDGPTTANGLTGTTISSSQVVASVSGAVGSVTGAVGSVTGAVGSVTGNVGGNVTGSVGSVVGAVGSVTGAVGSVTGNVGGNVTGSVGSVVGAVGSVTAAVTVGTNNDKTGYALTAAYDFSKGTVAMTESYAANTVAPTPAQALFAIQQMLTDFSIAGTTYTVLKLDHVTTAFLGTLDDAVTPTSLKRL